MKQASVPARQRGLTVVELLVALVLSLLLMTGIIQVFLASKQTYATNEAMSVLQENGRFALEFIARSVRIGGYVEPTALSLGTPLAVQGSGCTGLCTENGNGNASDQLAIAFQPPRDPATGTRQDCGGMTVADQRILVNVFRVQNGSLRCSSYQHTPYQLLSQNVELVSGIDRLQVLYGINTQGDLDSANQYVSADRVADWGQVRAVRVAVLANSLSPVSPAPPARPYILLDATPVSFDDRLARQIFTSTIQLKNID
jgi:type IV pilus assembly protein PilW